MAEVINGVMPYGAYDNNWGHRDLLEEHFGKNWREDVKQTLHWQRSDAGERMSGNRGSVYWAVCVEYKIQAGIWTGSKCYEGELLDEIRRR